MRVSSKTIFNKTLGAKVKEIRVSKGWSRQQLAEKIGVTHQQLQKYEKGTNRVCAERLVMLAERLGVGLDYLTDCESVGEPSFLGMNLIRSLEKLPRDKQEAIATMVRRLAE